MKNKSEIKDVVFYSFKNECGRIATQVEIHENRALVTDASSMSFWCKLTKTGKVKTASWRQNRS